MALNPINSQGVTVWVVAPALGSTAPTVALIQAGKEVGCLQSLGNIDQSRTVTELSCMNTDDTAKVLGSITRANTEIGMFLNPDDEAGQKALEDAFNNNTNVTIGIELPNKGTTNGTIYVFEAGVSSTSVGIEKDQAVTFNIVAEISSSITKLEAA